MYNNKYKNGDKNMRKKFHMVKISLISVVILCSSLMIICPITRSAPLDTIYECDLILVLDYNVTLLQEPIIPLADAREIPVQITGKITGPAVDIVAARLAGADIYLRPFIEEIPNGCHAAVNPPLIVLKLAASTEIIPANATVSIVVNEKLPALTQEHITIRLEAKNVGSNKATVIKGGNFIQKIPFTIGYYPQLDISTPDGNVKDISPDEKASFPIELENLGNGKTEITSEVIDIPEGWSASIISTTFGTDVLGDNNKETLYLEVNPPINFGYREDRAVIKVSITPSYHENPAYVGEPVYLSFIVQSRGFSTPGFEMIILLFAFIFVLFPLWKRKNSKIRKEQSRGGRE